MRKKYPTQHEVFNNNIIGRYKARKFFKSLNYSTKVIVPLTREINGKKRRVVEVATDEQATRIAFDWCYEQLGLNNEEKRIRYLEEFIIYLYKDNPNTAKELLNHAKPLGEETKRVRLESFCTPSLRIGVQSLKLEI